MDDITFYLALGGASAALLHPVRPNSPQFMGASRAVVTITFIPWAAVKSPAAALKPKS